MRPTRPALSPGVAKRHRRSTRGRSGERVSLADIARISAAAGYAAPDPTPEGGEAVAIGGDFALYRFADGLGVHFVDGVEQLNLTSAFTLGPGVTIFLLLEGYVACAVDGETLEIGADEDMNGYCGLVWSRAGPTRVERQLRRGRHVSKVTITLTPDWFANLGLDLPDSLARFRARRSAQMHWRPSERAIRNARDIVRPFETAPLLRRIAAQRRALEIVEDAFAAFEAEGGADAAHGLAGRASDARAYLDATLDREEPLGQVARNLGMSVTALQDCFRTSFGMTVGEYSRRQRLIRANVALRDEGVSVARAAAEAGYRSPANFATAFSREFGYPPSRARR